MSRSKTRVVQTALLVAAFILSGCALQNVDSSALGGFRLGHAVVVAKDVTKGPLSREIDPALIAESLKPKVEKELSIYQGDKYYHLGIGIDAYILAVPGVPVIASPKSALILTVNIWDDSAGAKITEEGHQFTILEDPSLGSFLGSGLTQSKEKQLDNLTKAASREIHRWIIENKDLFAPMGEETDDAEPTTDDIGDDTITEETLEPIEAATDA